MFPEEAIEFLREAVYDPDAERSYEMMSDRFIGRNGPFAWTTPSFDQGGGTLRQDPRMKR